MSKIWSVAEAKAHLSEVLRRAREEGPQRIGKRDACVVITEADWRKLTPEPVHLGRWLVENAPRALPGDPPFELPDRRDRRDRPTPFIDYATEIADELPGERPE